MVKYGRHLEFLRQRFPKSVYLVDYKGIQHSTDRAAFSADWQEGLARATAAKEEGVAGLWSRVFQGVSSDVRGVQPLVACTYHGAIAPERNSCSTTTPRCGRRRSPTGRRCASWSEV